MDYDLKQTTTHLFKHKTTTNVMGFLVCSSFNYSDTDTQNQRGSATTKINTFLFLQLAYTTWSIT